MQTIKSTPTVLLSRWSHKRFLVLICILALHLQLVSVNAVAQYSKLLDFGSKGGRYPYGSLISVGADLYGMTYGGGENDLGTIFKIKPDGSGYMKLLDFDGKSNGRNPIGSFFSDGSFLYGMTAEGGSNDMGTVFKIKSDGTGYVKLFDFAGLSNGSYPIGDLISDGTFLYGMTSEGGEFNRGTIFRIKPDGTSFRTQMEFSGSKDGSLPYGSLISDGTFLYGMTALGGANNLGTLFKIMPDGSGYIDLLDFNGGANGSNPYGSLLWDGKFLYGLTSTGGKNDDGVIFKIKADGTSYTNLLDLQGSFTGSNPLGSLITDGTFLYGLTNQYGAHDYGTIFKIKTDGTGFIDLFDFDSPPSGSYPYLSSLISDGMFLYGMTSSGGASNLGTVFRIKPDGTGYNNLHEFHTNGNGPNGSLISDGTSLYGMTAGGGANGYGTIFKIDPDGTGYINLFDFDSRNGSYPQGSLFFDGTFLYGMASSGGLNDSGTIFKIKPDGTGYATIFDFDFSANGDSPYGSLISDGTFLYGMTSYGGNDGGTIFKIKPNGTGYVTLSDFTSPGAGYQPYGDLLYDGTFLYGMTLRGGANREGTIFKLKPDGAGFATIYDFGASADGSSPYGSLISDGTFLYGMTQAGGMGGGTLFRIMPDGKGYVKLRNFVGVDIFDGSSPYGSLRFDGTFLYGLTAYGGENNLGTLFKMRPDGTEYTKLLDFDGRINGNNPRGSLLQIGFSLYGMTQAGGINTDLGGTIFKYELPNPCPDVVTITATSTELTASSSGDSYQWYYFGEVISGATNQSLTFSMLEYGEYAVDVIKNGCTYTATFDYIITGQQKEINASVQVFPNPVKENLNVTLPQEGYALKIVDPLGRVFLEQPGAKGTNELKTIGLTPGLYYLIAKSHDDVIVFKVQKQ